MHINPSLGKTTYKQDIEYEEAFFSPFGRTSYPFICYVLHVN